MNTKKTASWGALENEVAQLKGITIKQLFSEDPQRFEKFSIASAGILLDYSKNLLTEKTLSLLFDLAEEKNVRGFLQTLFGVFQALLETVEVEIRTCDCNF